MSRLFCALVIKDNLQVQPGNIPDVKFCWADDYESAAKVLRRANWPQAFWVNGKSICRIIKLFEVFEGDAFPDDKQLHKLLSKDVLRLMPEQVSAAEPPTRRRRRKTTAKPQPSKLSCN